MMTQKETDLFDANRGCENLNATTGYSASSGIAKVEIHLVTLVLTVNGPETIWLLADRRLAFRPPKKAKDDARKAMFLETTDGTAILGYAGLGVTADGTEPADWMSRVLRGRNLPLEPSLDVLAKAIETQVPQHLLQLPGAGPPAHNVIATAFLGNEVTVYTIDLAFWAGP